MESVLSAWPPSQAVPPWAPGPSSRPRFEANLSFLGGRNAGLKCETVDPARPGCVWSVGASAAGRAERADIRKGQASLQAWLPSGAARHKATCPSCVLTRSYFSSAQMERPGPVLRGACSLPHSLGPRAHPTGAEGPTQSRPSPPGLLCSHQAWEETAVDCRVSSLSPATHAHALLLSSTPGVPEAERQTPDSAGRTWGRGTVGRG